MSGGVALWTAEQQRWLAALGHTVWVHGALPEIEAEAVAQVDEPARALPPARREFQPRPAPKPRIDAIDTAPVAAPAARAASRLPDKLHFALIRAAGINPNAPDMAAVIAQWPASAELRGNPAAKRALWPRLRALRKGRPA